VNEDYLEGYKKGVEDAVQLMKKVFRGEKDDLLDRVKDYLIKKAEGKPKHRRTKPKFVLKYGSTVLVNEKKGKKIYKIFDQALERSSEGLCITHRKPSAVKFSKDVRVIWLTDYRGNEEQLGGMGAMLIGNGATYSEDRIPPGDLSTLTHVIKKFMGEDRHRVIMIDNLNRIIMRVGDRQADIIKFLDTIRGCTAEHDGVLLISVDLNEINSPLRSQIEDSADDIL